MASMCPLERLFNVMAVTIKARLVSGGHVKKTLATITYARVVSQETVITALILSALNNFPVKVADTQNSYIMEPATEKIQTVHASKKTLTEIGFPKGFNDVLLLSSHLVMPRNGHM